MTTSARSSFTLIGHAIGRSSTGTGVASTAFGGCVPRAAFGVANLRLQGQAALRCSRRWPSSRKAKRLPRAAPALRRVSSSPRPCTRRSLTAVSSRCSSLAAVAAAGIEPEGFDPQLEFQRLALEDFAFATGRREVFPHVGQRLLAFRRERRGVVCFPRATFSRVTFNSLFSISKSDKEPLACACSLATGNRLSPATSAANLRHQSRELCMSQHWIPSIRATW